MNVDKIPAELKQYSNWVAWTPDKTPINPHTLGGANSTDKNTWGTFDQAFTAIGKMATYWDEKSKTTKQAETEGVGFVFSVDDPFIGVDLDKVRSGGNIDRRAIEIIMTLQSYTEISPSGTGYHIICKGKKPGSKCKKSGYFGGDGAFEIYDRNRYFTFTGKHDNNTPKEVMERQDAINKLYADVWPEQEKPKTAPRTTAPTDMTDRDLIELALKAKNGAKFKALFDGDTSEHGGDHSSADQALCNLLAYWTGRDPQRMDSIFRQSGLMRDKWDARRGGSTYGVMTIEKAIADVVEVYDPQRPEESYKIFIESQQKASKPNAYYIYEDGNGKKYINTALLADYIKKNEHYIIARKPGVDADILYWYADGYYQRINVNEFKGQIKKHIPLVIRKPKHWEEAYKELMTDKATITVDALDTNTKYINFKNGLYNVETRELEAHRPDILSTIRINANYNPKAPAPALWMEYLDFLTGGDADLQSILQEWAGLTISNIEGYKPKKALALYGPEGNNGKTQYLNMLGHLIGRDFVATRDIQDLTKPFATSDLYGKRALLIDDQKSSDFADSSIFKSITGGGCIACEFKGKPSFSYVFKGSVAFGCNELPYIKDEKGSHLFERFQIIPCTNVLTEAQRDPLIFDRMRCEVDSVAAWAIDGLHRLIDNNYKLTESELSKEAVMEYRKKSDSLFRFVSENYALTGDPKDRMRKTEFEAAYDHWAFMHDVKHPIEKRNIKDRAQKMGIAYKKSSFEFYTGIRPLDIKPTEGNSILGK